MATKTKKEELKEEKNEELEDKTQEQETEDQTKEKEDSSTQKTEPETKETLGTKAKGLGKKVISGVKKALPYVGAFAAGAGAAVGALIVMTKPDGTEVAMLPQDDSMVPVDDFIEGEGTVVDESSDEG